MPTRDGFCPYTTAPRFGILLSVGSVVQKPLLYLLPADDPDGEPRGFCSSAGYGKGTATYQNQANEHHAIRRS
jgi:hypothetical protein